MTKEKEMARKKGQIKGVAVKRIEGKKKKGGSRKTKRGGALITVIWIDTRTKIIGRCKTRG